MMESAYIALGSNLNEPVQQIHQALLALAELPGSQLRRVSSLYASAPLGPSDQPEFVNAVARLDTQLEPLALLDRLQEIEQQQGRVRQQERWGPRTLDLDILLYGDQQLNLPRLQVPHYHLQARPFCLYPLAEIAAELCLPDGRPLALLLADCPAVGLHLLAAPPSISRQSGVHSAP